MPHGRQNYLICLLMSNNKLVLKYLDNKPYVKKLNSINKIARMNLERIFKDENDFNKIIFSKKEFDFEKKVLITKDLDSNGSYPGFGVLNSKDIDSKKVVQYYIWGLRLGLPEIPMLPGTKTMAERIIEEEEKGCWMMNKKNPSHFVEERIVDEHLGYPISEITVYRISDEQWKKFADEVIGNYDLI